ncbi:NAD(P)-dependent alcohol dehydrogenase [Sphingomonas sp. 37zxx]|uniref:NAD(P)-dependent alcohol dehydrogenase n=1 Tax=Sphingomonas sp. 37zxx TaxID=1550073 RepID=UPI00053C0040|nr:NAD(P)-dependent alcohol dehydrogenase [Sphingomonas sp. 37zxx]
MKIQAAVVDAPGMTPAIRQLRIDAPRPDEVLVRIHAAGICHTDMVLRDGHLPLTFPAVLGHEGAGIVEQVGAEVHGLFPGDRVVLSFRSCGTCPSCTDHAPAYCHQFVPLNFDGRRTDGSHKLFDDQQGVSGNVFGQSCFASHVLAYADNVIRVEADVPFHLLAPLGCGIQTGVGTVLEALKVRRGERIAILGAGGVGLAAVMAARIAQAGLIAVIDRHDTRQQLAKSVGATCTSANVGDLPGDFDHIIDTTGVIDLAATAAQKLAIRGTLALVGAYPPVESIAIGPAFLMSAGRRIIGVIEGSVEPKKFVPRLAQMVETGALPIDRLVQCYPFDQIVEAIADSESGRVVKPVLTF